MNCLCETHIQCRSVAGKVWQNVRCELSMLLCSFFECIWKQEQKYCKSLATSNLWCDGSQNFKSSSSDPFPTLFNVILQFFVSNFRCAKYAFQIWSSSSFTRSRGMDPRASQNFKSRSRDPFRPLWPNFAFFVSASRGQESCEIWRVCQSSKSRSHGLFTTTWT